MLYIAMILVASPAVVADPAPGAPLPAFSGRSGATKEKTIVIGCAEPERAEPPAPGWVLDLAVLVRNAAAVEAHNKLLRGLTEGGSSDWLSKGPRSKEEILKELPPKYREMAKEYFEMLERAQKEKK